MLVKRTKSFTNLTLKVCGFFCPAVFDFKNVSKFPTVFLKKLIRNYDTSSGFNFCRFPDYLGCRGKQHTSNTTTMTYYVVFSNQCRN